MSLFTTISGITNNQAMLDVIGDNIANINTVAFKSSKISFETIFSNTLSSGGVPTQTSGGTNPKQVGLGVTISEISKNFGRGSIQTTGRNTDLNIQGEGFFTLMDSSEKMVLTRAGNFSVDSEGNLVNPKGLRVLGTGNVTSSASSTTTVQIPTALVLNETNVMSDGTTAVTPGTFTISVNAGAPINITVADTDTVQDIVNKINSTMSGVPSLNVAALNSSNQIVITGADTVALANGTSNFATVAALAGGPPPTAYTSAGLSDNPQVDILAEDATSDNNFKVTSYSIGSEGAVEVTYSNGARLTVTGDPTRSLKYVSSRSEEITGANITQSGGTTVNPAQLQLQLAQVINPKGLQSAGGNLFTISSVAGTPNFAIGGNGGLGSIDAGSLEASNVDLPTEFANMILAQKAVEANSRAFSIQNQIMDAIVNLGR